MMDEYVYDTNDSDEEGDNDMYTKGDNPIDLCEDDLTDSDFEKTNIIFVDEIEDEEPTLEEALTKKVDIEKERETRLAKKLQMEEINMRKLQELKDQNKKNEAVNESEKDQDISHCPICLGPFELEAIIEGCWHRFCFVCILQWSQITSFCPLCKKLFSRLLYDITTDLQYRTFDISSLKTSKKGEGEVVLEKFPSDAHRQRQSVYNLKQKVLPLPTSKAHPLIPLSPGTLSEKWDRKLRPWLTRELQALLEDSDVDLLIHWSHALLQHHPLDSPQARIELEPFLHENTEQFINEFQMFASCPFDMNTYDRLVRYDTQTEIPKLELDTQTSPKRKELTTSNSKRPSKRVRTSLSSSCEREQKKSQRIRLMLLI